MLPAIAIFADVMAPGSGAAATATAKLGGQLLEAQVQRRKAEPDFRSALTEARDQLTSREKNRPIRPILVVIDELDRCRPDYAIRMLERIKHYFDIPGIIFLIATDRGILPSAVKTVYGSHVDGELYLRKFFDYEFHLPEPSTRKYARTVIEADLFPGVNAYDISKATSRNYFRELDGHISTIDELPLCKAEYLEHFPDLASAMNLSLRDTAQAFTMLAAFAHSRSGNDPRLPIIDSYICCLRFSHPEGFRLLIEEGKLFDAHKDAPLSLRNLYEKIGKSNQWASVSAFFGRNVYVDFNHSIHDRPRQLWEKILGKDGTSHIDQPSGIYKALLAIRVRNHSDTPPERYAQDVVRLSAPILPK